MIYRQTVLSDAPFLDTIFKVGNMETQTQQKEE